ncbi:hypothetical protein F5876DRAFT_70182 [Lentinula aff. lateritia]|uniref:Uncharacterized protein n=1 Tax=Lentinula aff. lateritia TaxID=2804960 RepID=A0ACC1TJW6_9AGAR|nr:hypothetical protein F5876DRAFT_70182 [Lentinula aff. lateritia]
MTENIVAVDITPIKHDEFKKPPPTPMFRFSTMKQLHRNLEYIANAKIIVDDNATLGFLKPQEQVELDQLYNRRSINAFIYYIDISILKFSYVSALLTISTYFLHWIQRRGYKITLNLKTRYRVRGATGSAGIFGKAVWTTSERIKQEEEARRHELFLRTEISESIVFLSPSSQNDYLHQLHQNTSNLADTGNTQNMFATLLDHIYPKPLNKGYLLPIQTLETLPLRELSQSVASHIPPGPQQELFIANPNSRNTSVEGSLPDVQNSSGLYISSGPQQTPYFISSNSRNISTEGLPPSTQMGSNLSLSQQTAMTGSSGPGCYPRSGSVNTASLEDDGTHFSIGSRASGSSEMYQLDPSTGYYSGEPSSSRYPAMYNSGKEYYHNQTQMTGRECIITDQKILDIIMHNMMMLTSLMVTGVCILKQGLTDAEQYQRIQPRSHFVS